MGQLKNTIGFLTKKNYNREIFLLKLINLGSIIPSTSQRERDKTLYGPIQHKNYWH